MKKKKELYFKRAELAKFLEEYRKRTGTSYLKMGDLIGITRYQTLMRTLNKIDSDSDVYKTYNHGFLNMPGSEAFLCTDEEAQAYEKEHCRRISAARRKARRKAVYGTRIDGMSDKIRPGRAMMDPKRGTQAYYSTFGGFHVYNHELVPQVTFTALESEHTNRLKFAAKNPALFKPLKSYAGAKRRIDAIERKYMRFVGRDHSNLSESEDPWTEY